MATKQQVKEQFIQALIDTIVKNSSVNLTEYRRNIDESGQFTTSAVDDNQQVVVYNETYQSYHTFNDTVDDLVECFETDAIEGNADYPVGGYENFISDGLTYQADNIYYSCWDTGEEVGNYTTNDECIDTGCILCNFQSYGEQGNPVVLFNFETVTCGINYITITDEVLPILSQLVGFNTSYDEIDPIKAQEVLDTEIFELIPKSKTKQKEIDDFFAAYHRLKGDLPNWDSDYNDDGVNDHFTDSEEEIEYDDNHNISSTNLDGSIVRLKNQSNSDNPPEKTLEGLRENIDTFLRDIDSELDPSEEDERPEYEHKSPGHIKIRHLNQAIIVRNKEGDDIGIIGDNKENPDWWHDGFTITMWVKFMDKVSSGTLFNFGNPLRTDTPYGFMLETFVVDQDESFDFQPTEYGFFEKGEQERFVRLVVRDENDLIRDSHMGMNFGQEYGDSYGDRLDTAIDNTTLPALEQNLSYAFNYTHIPIDLNEWYFIVANFNTGVDEQTSINNTASLNNPDYWRWNWDGSAYTHYSGLGAKCKVEIISKSDLIRARGFKLDKS